MKKAFPLLVIVATCLVAPASVFAQSGDYHPALSDRFTFSIGAFRSSNSFKVEAHVFDEINPDIDFGDSLGVSDTSTLVNAQLRWKFGSERKWSIWGQYFTNNAEGGAVLTEDVKWEGVIFREGTYAAAGVKMAIARVFVGRSFVLNDQHDFGVGAGLHNLDMDIFIEGEIIIDDDTTGVKRFPVDGSQILPNVGTWWNYSPASKWLIHSRLDWISANIGDYDGGLWNASIGVNWQAFEHFGFDLSWQYFNLNITVDKDDWKGGADMTYSGPVLGVTAIW